MLSYLPANSMEDPPVVDTGDDRGRTAPELDRIIPDSPNQGYDMRDVIRSIVDNGDAGTDVVAIELVAFAVGLRQDPPDPAATDGEFAAMAHAAVATAALAAVTFLPAALAGLALGAAACLGSSAAETAAPPDGDAVEVPGEGQQVALVFEQDHRFMGDGAC